MRRKYHSKKVRYQGMIFDSKKECYRYIELKKQEAAGLISNLERQKSFELIPVQREPSTITKRGKEKQGKVIERAVNYLADFVYIKDGKTIVEDTKGFKTTDYIIKRKLMLYIHGIRIKEI